eukprot:9644717-Alexandrium_andersonii.AAC.1
MPALRSQVRQQVAAAIAAGQVSSLADYAEVLVDYEDHAPLREGQEALTWEPVDEDELGSEAETEARDAEAVGPAP